MKNLNITEGRRVNFGKKIVGHCIDSDNRTLYVLASDYSVLYSKFDSTQVEELAFKLNDTILEGANLSQIDVILVEYIVESRSIIIALRNGQILQISLLTNEPICDTLHQHPTNLCSVKYSPNQDLVALADYNNELSIYTTNFELIGTTNALNENNSAHKPVGVGWGSKETQFFGLDGRPSKERGTKDQAVIDGNELKEIEVIESSGVFAGFRQPHLKNTVIDWRGDGHFLATLIYIVDTDKHYLKVWNRNLELQYMSEQLVTVERGLLSWVPNGHYICLAQHRDRRVNEIALFEKNGMVHQRITLPLNDHNLYIQSMCWSTDSKILTVLANSFSLEDGEVICEQILFFYTMQNFHYYLKASFHLGDSIFQLKWDSVDSRLHLFDGLGHYVPLYCRFAVNYTLEQSTVYVVDANRILITPLDICNVPPPMSALEIVMSDLIKKIVPCPRKNQVIFILTSDGKLFCNIQSKTGSKGKAEPSTSLKLNVQTAAALVDNFENMIGLDIAAVDELQHLKCVRITGTYHLVAAQQATSIKQLILIEPLMCQKSILYSFSGRQILSIAQNPSKDDDSQMALVFDDGIVEYLDLATKTILLQVPMFSPEVIRALTDFVDVQLTELESENHLLTLSSDSTLRYDSKVLASNCTSFRTTKHYLIYTTTDNNINLVLLDGLYNIIHNTFDIKSWSQAIENGGTLISASELSSKVVLQMPRGNLETLHLRLFIFTSLTNLLAAGRYVEAIKLARRHRVNQNYLCDYLLRLADAPFLITKFAALIAEEDPTLLNLFISELEDIDTISSRYQNIAKHLPKSCAIPKLETSLTNGEKVNQICSYIILPGDPRYLQPRLLCLLKSKPAKTTEALKIIHDLPKDLRESCLRFVLYFVEVEQLFIEAIKTYDTDIALMVSGASNKDPKEYLALLDGFNSTTNLSLRRYQMDLYVGNYESAFDNLLEYLPLCDDKSKIESDLTELVSSKRIYKHATSVLNKQPNFDELTQTVWLKYADYLLEKKYYLEAGIAYGKALALSNNLEYLSNALKCFFLANSYETSLALVARTNANEELKNEYRAKITKQLFERGRNLDAIAIMQSIPEKTLDDRVSDMINQGEWYLAEYFSSEEIRSSTHVNNLISILEFCDTNLQSTNETYRTVKLHFERLLKLIEDYDESRFNNPDYVENLTDSLSTIDGSEVSSLAASALNPRKGAPRSGAPSLKTRASSKSTRSQSASKKRINLRQGSRHEDLALVLELQKFVSRLTRWQETNVRISAALFTYCDLNIARDRIEAMHQMMSNSYDLAKKITETLWPNSNQQDDKYSLYRRFGANISFSPETPFDNTDLQVLIRPELPKSLTTFEL